MECTNNYYYSIYQHTFPNGKIYIGITNQKPENRWANGKGYSKQPLMCNAIKKYGWENVKHEILMFGLTKEEAERYERRLIIGKCANDRRIGDNRENGGNSPGKCSPEVIEKHRIAATGRRHAEETKQALREKSLNRPSAFKGHHHSDEAKLLLSIAHTGKRHTESAKQKMSEARCGENNHMFGKHQSEATILLIRESQRNNFKPVRCVELETVYESKSAAANALGVSYGNLKTVCDKPNRTVKGFHIVSVEAI